MGICKRPSLFLEGCDFVHVNHDGLKEIIYKAASIEDASSIAEMLDEVSIASGSAGYFRGQRYGRKDGLMLGAALGLGISLSVFLGLVMLTEVKSKRKKTEDDAE